MKLFKDELTGVLKVSKYDEVKSFYEEKVGLSCVKETVDADGRKHAIFYVTGGGSIEVAESEENCTSGPTSFWMEARDINGLYSAMQKDGLDLFDPIEDKYFHARSFQMRDPAGNATFVVAYEQNVQPYMVDAVKGSYFKDEFRTVLFVDDLDACYKYFTDVLEMPCIYQWNECEGDKGFKYRATESGAYIETLHRIPLTDQGPAVIRLVAEDIRECYAAISKKEEANVIRELECGADGKYSFVLEDPDRNQIIICES